MNISSDIKHPSTGWLSILKEYVCVPLPLSTIVQVPVTPAWSGCGKLATSGRSEISQATVIGNPVKVTSTAPLTSNVNSCILTKQASIGWLSIVKL